MSDPFLAEIRAVGFNFPPTGWAACDGQLLPISQNTALFALLGTTYGGNGSSNFALPNLRGRSPLMPGQGSGLTDRALGASGGAATVTLTHASLPAHTHQVRASDLAANDNDPGPAAVLGAPIAGPQTYAPAIDATVPLAQEALASAGSSQPHNNLQPYLTLNFVIAMQGIFPQRP